MIIYLNYNYSELNKANLSPFDRGFLFGDGVYEVIRTYNKKFFLFDEHIFRLKRNCQELQIDYSDFESIEAIARELIVRNDLTNKDISLYVQITRGGSFPRIHSFPAVKTEPNIFLFINEIKGGRFENASIITSEDIRWKRCDIKSINLLPSILANQNAKVKGCTESVWLNNGRLLEGTHTNIFAIKDGSVVTPPLSNSILPGITREFILKICRENSIDFREEEIELKNLDDYGEFFLTGTLTEIKPIIKANDNTIGKGMPGEITQKIIKIFSDHTS